MQDNQVRRICGRMSIFFYESRLSGPTISVELGTASYNFGA
jgi:hypothetical protein